MTIQYRKIDYQDGEITLQGHMAWDDSATGRRPSVLVSHAWQGRSDFENEKAEQLAAMGYVGFALDMYGKGVQGETNEEKAALMQPFLDDREMLQARISAALITLREQKEVDASQIGAIGYCFGGLCVLDLARTGADVKGVVSFHGLFKSPGNTDGNRIPAKVLALHGWDDPMVPPDEVVGLGRELTAGGADWQIHAYGGTSHAFTNPQANDAALGLMHNPDAERRSWLAMTQFLAESFAGS